MGRKQSRAFLLHIKDPLRMVSGESSPPKGWLLGEKCNLDLDLKAKQSREARN